MLKHLLKLAIRNFKANKLIFIGSIATVFLGTLCLSLMYSYVHNELTMDDFHKRKNDLYILTIKTVPESKWETIEASWFFEFNYKDYSELDGMVLLKKYPQGALRVDVNDKVFSPEILVSDSNFFKIFDFKLVIGNKLKALSNPSSAVITESFAKKVFGNENPIGKTIKICTGTDPIYTISSVVADVPSNSSLKFDIIVQKTWNPNDYNNVGINIILIKQNCDKVAFAKKIEKVGRKHHQFKNSIMGIIPYNGIYFNKNSVIHIEEVFKQFGDKSIINILFVIMLIILLLSALNFSNLQILNINTSFKGICISKINGANGRYIVGQKCLEILIIIGITTFLLTVAYGAILPKFNALTCVMLAPSLWEVILINISIITPLTILAITYPVILALRIPVIISLKKQISYGKNIWGRKSVLIIQFSIAITLLISAIVVERQLNLMLNKNLGFSSENIIRVKMFHEKYNYEMEKIETKNCQFVKNELAYSPSIEMFSQGNSPLKITISPPWKLNDSKNDYSSQNVMIVDPNYQNLFGFQLLEGRYFDLKKDKSRVDKIVINEAAMKFWNIRNISKSRLINYYWSEDNLAGFEIIGVIKDFNYQRLSVKPQPLIMYLSDDLENDFFIKFKKGSSQTGLKFVNQTFKKVHPNETFIYSNMSDEIQLQYEKEKRLGIIYSLFTLVAIIITTIGLFTIALYDTKKRTKEIGILKVNGAQVSEVMVLLNKDFIQMVVIGFIIACPIAYYAMNKWLNNFAYRIELSWWIFATAGGAVLLIAITTISWQTWRAASRNPVESLRSE